ncbi:hypothetical protein Tco_1386187 [Tanacetum coccineum]
MFLTSRPLISAVVANALLITVFAVSKKLRSQNDIRNGAGLQVVVVVIRVVLRNFNPIPYARFDCDFGKIGWLLNELPLTAMLDCDLWSEGAVTGDVENGFIRPSVSTMGFALRSYLLEEGWEHGAFIIESSKYIFTQRELNLRQRIWLVELLKDYALNIQYIRGKANVGLPDALKLLKTENLLVYEFSVDDDGVVWLKIGYVFSNDQALREKNYGIIKLAEIFDRKLVDCMVHDFYCVDRDPKFTSRFLEKAYQKAWGTVLSAVQHFILQIDGSQRGQFRLWKVYVKGFTFELLYGRKCRAPICWDEVGERLIEGPELIEITNEKVAVAKENLKEG